VEPRLAPRDGGAAAGSAGSTWRATGAQVVDGRPALPAESV
jgi:hypothetical protein